MKTDTIDIGLYLIFAIFGFLVKFALERYSKHKDSVRLEGWKLELSNLEAKLSQFYWPLHCRLKRGSIAWEAENFRKKIKTEDGEKFAQTFDETVIVANHEQTREIIQSEFHHFGGDKELVSALIKLLHHIDVYLALRKSGSRNDPIWVGQPWPTGVENLIESNLHKYQKQYDQLLEKARQPL